MARTDAVLELQCGRVAEDAESDNIGKVHSVSMPRLQCGRVAEDAESRSAIERSPSK